MHWNLFSKTLLCTVNNKTTFVIHAYNIIVLKTSLHQICNALQFVMHSAQSTSYALQCMAIHRYTANCAIQCNSCVVWLHRSNYAMQCMAKDAWEERGEGFHHWLRVNNPLPASLLARLISVPFQLVFPMQLLTAVIASFAAGNYGEGLPGCCRRIYVHPAIGVLGSFEASSIGCWFSRAVHRLHVS